LLVTCILTSVPIIALGIIAMIFLYKPEMKWQIDAKNWLLPLFIVVYCLIVEFVLVAIPTIMFYRNKKKENSKQKDEKIANKEII
jgi:preprotein translocase subunit YajC